MGRDTLKTRPGCSKALPISLSAFLQCKFTLCQYKTIDPCPVTTDPGKKFFSFFSYKPIFILKAVSGVFSGLNRSSSQPVFTGNLFLPSHHLQPNRSFYFLNWGLQKWRQYFLWGLMRAEQRRITSLLWSAGLTSFFCAALDMKSLNVRGDGTHGFYEIVVLPLTIGTGKNLLDHYIVRTRKISKGLCKSGPGCICYILQMSCMQIISLIFSYLHVRLIFSFTRVLLCSSYSLASN